MIPVDRTATGFRLHKRVVETLRDIPPEIWKRCLKLFEQIGRGPEAVRGLKGCKKVKGARVPLFEARIEKDWRAIWMQQPNGEPYVLVIGTHDHVFSMGRRAAQYAELDDSPSIDPDVLLSIAEPRASEYTSNVEHVRSPVWAPFARVPLALFDFWHLSSDVTAVIQGLRDENDLAGLIGQIPDGTVEAIIDWARDGTIRRPGEAEEFPAATVLLETGILVPAVDEMSGDIVSPFALTRELLVEIGTPEDQISNVLRASNYEELEQLSLPFGTAAKLLEHVTIPRLTGIAAADAVDWYAPSAQDLDDYYTQRITQLLLHLAPGQTAVVDLPAPGVHMVKGVAGSGKTTVALYRARRLIREKTGTSVLFLTYTKTLARTARELAEELLTPEEAKCFRIRNLDAWMMECLRRNRRNTDVVGDTDRPKMARGAIETVRQSSRSKVLLRSPEWFLEEISNAIKGRGIATADDYRSLDRAGRQTALSGAARDVVWAVYEHYQRELAPRIDWDDVPLLVREIMRGDTRTHVDHVIIDEAQDFSPVELEVAGSVCGRGPRSLMVVADAAQSIHRGGFRWKDLGEDVRGGKIHVLRDNYRNTAEILHASNALLERNPSLREDGEAGVLDRNTPRRGPKPFVVVCNDPNGQVQSLVRRIGWLREHRRVPFGNIAVLVMRKQRLREIEARLAAKQVPTVRNDSDSFAIGSDHVKLCTLHSAKGLEFPVVFITDVDQDTLPRVNASMDEDETVEAWMMARRLLYVGLTRAMQEVYVLTTKNRESPLLKEIPEELLQIVAGR